MIYRIDDIPEKIRSIIVATQSSGWFLSLPGRMTTSIRRDIFHRENMAEYARHFSVSGKTVMIWYIRNPGNVQPPQKKRPGKIGCLCSFVIVQHMQFHVIR